MATVSEAGWPYIQHRGGPVGFLKVLDERTLGLGDFRGNRQYISLGNVASDDRTALFLMDYPNRQRLKILAHMSVRDLAAEPDLAERLLSPGYKGRPERAFILELESFDWNCPQHITPRFTADEVAAGTSVLRERLAQAEAELKDPFVPKAAEVKNFALVIEAQSTREIVDEIFGLLQPDIQPDEAASIDLSRPVEARVEHRERGRSSPAIAGLSQSSGVNPS
jgi:predicted pyridoxine 5'-phosphate oxidase superfamily flavin-nucleotide-binding protein